MNPDLMKSLISLMLPEGILDYFDVVSYEQIDSGKHVYNKKIIFHLEEKDIIPKEYSGIKHKCCGFMPAREIEDCAIRSSLVSLSVRRRRWEVEIEGKKRKVTRNWKIVQEGTRMSAEYAAFLKEVSRY